MFNWILYGYYFKFLNQHFIADLVGLFKCLYTACSYKQAKIIIKHLKRTKKKKKLCNMNLFINYSDGVPVILKKRFINICYNLNFMVLNQNVPKFNFFK